MIETEEVMDSIKEEIVKKCICCGKLDDFNICVRCDGIVSARKAFKEFFMFRQSINAKYQAIVEHRKDLKTKEEKEKEFAKIMNSFTVINKFKDAEAQAKSRNNTVGVDGLNAAEKQLFHSIFSQQYIKLKENYEYGAKKIGFDPVRDCFVIKDIDFFIALKQDNLRKEATI